MPLDIGRNVSFGFTDDLVTARGGLALLAQLAKFVGLPDMLGATPAPRRPRARRTRARAPAPGPAALARGRGRAPARAASPPASAPRLAPSAPRAPCSPPAAACRAASNSFGSSLASSRLCFARTSRSTVPRSARSANSSNTSPSRSITQTGRTPSSCAAELLRGPGVAVEARGGVEGGQARRGHAAFRAPVRPQGEQEDGLGRHGGAGRGEAAAIQLAATKQAPSWQLRSTKVSSSRGS